MTASTKELEAAFGRIVLWPQHDHSMSQVLAYVSQHVVRAYCNGLNQSIDMVLRARGTAYEAHALYETLSTGGEMVPDQGYAEKVRATFKHMNESIPLVVLPFYETLQGIMEVLNTLNSVKRDAENEQEEHGKAMETARNTVLHSTVGLAGQAALQIIGQMKTGVPPNLVSPLLTFVGGTANELIRHGPEIIGQINEGRRCAGAIKHIQLAIEDLHTLVDHATSTATWWEGLHTTFTQTYQRMEDTPSEAEFQLHVQQIADETKQVQDQLTNYAESLTGIQDSYTSLL